MSTKILNAITRSLFDTNMVSSRIMLAIAEMLWAVLLFWPGDTFGRPTYTVMSHIMNEEAWASVFLLSSITQATIILRHEFHCWAARYFAAWNAVLWCVVVVSMLLSVYPPPAAISGEITLAIAAFWIWLRPFIILRGIEYARAEV